jgi:predicted RNA binding protein YcfA (HicA-like mRNA interferase family)
MKVSEVIEHLTAKRWFLVIQHGSHRQYKHPILPGRVTVAGKPSDDLALGTQQHGQTSGLEKMRSS